MQIFCADTLTDLFLRCRENAEYRAIIVFNTHQRTREFYQEMYNLHQIEPIDGVVHILFDIFNNIVRIEFANNSCIDAMASTSEILLGRTYHEGVIEEDLMSPETMLRVQSHISEYRAPTRRRRRRIPTVDFNDEFNIAYSVWDNSKLTPEPKPDNDLNIDKQSEEMLNEFLNSFKIKDSFKFTT